MKPALLAEIGRQSSFEQDDLDLSEVPRLQCGHNIHQGCLLKHAVARMQIRNAPTILSIKH